MRLSNKSILLLELAGSALAMPARRAATAPVANHAKAHDIREAFEISWNGYYKHAFPHDTLHPVTNTYVDDRAGWGVTVVDALDTAIVMNSLKIVQPMLDHIAKIDFTTTAKADDAISLFETNIRYLGGLLSAYDLLKGPYKQLGADADKVDALLKQAQSLGDSLSVAFDTPSGIPDPTIFLNPTKKNSGTDRNNIAEIGTLVLEWTRLSDLSGNKTYAELAQKAENYLLHPKGAPEAWPGLIGTWVSTENGSFLDSNGGWSAYDDSFYEYLIKMYVYDPKAFGEYKDRWVAAVDSTMRHLVSHPTTRKDLSFLSAYRGQQTIPNSGHLASFAGGNFILGGIVLGEEKYKQLGLEITDSYYETYVQEAAGIGPEGFNWVDAGLSADNPNNRPPPTNQTEFYEKAGFYNTSPYYILRPETVESIYYAYRLTGDKKYQDMAWDAFQQIRKLCRVNDAYAELTDVSKTNGGSFVDEMQSFWMAETLKYLYLTFAADGPVHVQGQGATNQFVYNTEAHPVAVRGRQG
ncbi:putative mannosyl-oligosaccharide alpha-1,2-mannosidase [Metarhizium anisopliae BRIP 53293]|uniref:alpha-1,2-Mannosidase n=1 Tax=Metarhizium anisopliae BRIP 53293 TaxID=1291518 RepID=A0A0D9P6D2_METAN|nr:putative mannosyl-oligosaccharide alpha-1,2-mannosidase [Metarhizium anisopliae BRIP 53293]KJK94277.1 putative mannosyl-oligosaccharide alpha-1,2-mannosidase [Metarhizium anisopliae BRIP 53284]